MATQHAQPTPLTADDLLRMPDSKLYELIRGVLVPRPLSSFESSVVGATIAGELWRFVHDRGLGGVTGADGGYQLEHDPDTVRVMDAAFVRADRLPPAEEWDRFLELAPDLAVEVVSPYDTETYMHGKLCAYFDAGVPLIWIVFPTTRTVTVWRPDRTGRLLDDTATLDGGDVLPGFRLPVVEIFA